MIAAYGLRLDGADGPSHWPRWTMRTQIAVADDRDGLSVWPDRARIGLPGLGELRIDRRHRTIVAATAVELSTEAVMHPGLAPVAAVNAHWEGWPALHAAAVTVEGAAWGLFAQSGGGKSTTAALLSASGCAFLTDDMLVAMNGRAAAGPPSVDLRPDAAERLGGERLGHRNRSRRPLERPRLEDPLVGFVCLEWGPASARRLTGAQRLDVLRDASVLPIPGEELLALAALPMIAVQRPRDLDVARSGTELILEVMRKEARHRSV